MSLRVALTAAEGAFTGLADELADADVTLRVQPLLRFAEPESWQSVDAALAELGEFGALAVTSPRGASALAGRIAMFRAKGAVHGVPWRMPPRLAVWTAGAATAAALGDLVAHPHCPADGAVRVLGAGAALAEAMLAAGVRGPVLFVCGDRRRDELPMRLRAAGLEVQEAVCYRTVVADVTDARETAAGADVIVVASPSVAQLLGRCGAVHRPPLIAIGPTTTSAAAAAGWPAAVTADAPTPAAVARAIRHFLPS